MQANLKCSLHCILISQLKPVSRKCEFKTTTNQNAKCRNFSFLAWFGWAKVLKAYSNRRSIYLDIQTCSLLFTKIRPIREPDFQHMTKISQLESEKIEWLSGHRSSLFTKIRPIEKLDFAHVTKISQWEGESFDWFWYCSWKVQWEQKCQNLSWAKFNQWDWGIWVTWPELTNQRRVFCVFAIFCARPSKRKIFVLWLGSFGHVA